VADVPGRASVPAGSHHHPAGCLLAVFAAAGFLLFRFFDVVKVWPIKVFEKFPGGIGIVADDLAAGYFAAACLIIGWKVFA
jgi:phosphatidylglycerophosphatase A